MKEMFTNCLNQFDYNKQYTKTKAISNRHIVLVCSVNIETFSYEPNIVLIITL